MAIRITKTRYDVYEIADNPTPAVYIEGFCVSDDIENLPTDIGGSAIATGSKIKNITTGVGTDHVSSSSSQK